MGTRTTVPPDEQLRDLLGKLLEGTTVLVSLDAGEGRWLVLDADGHRAAAVKAGPPKSPGPGVEVLWLPAYGPEWYCDDCERELDRSCPIPVDDNWAVCRGCAGARGFPAAWRSGDGSPRLCPCGPCVAAAGYLSTDDRDALLLRSGRLTA